MAEKQQSIIEILFNGKDNVSKSAKQVSGGITSLGSSAMKLAGIFGIAFSATKIVGFVNSSVKAFVEADSQMNLVKETVKSLGLSYDDVGPKIEDFANKMAQMGRDDEDAAVATAKLAKILGGDLNQAMQMTKLASDLTASGFGDMNSNVENLSKVLLGRGSRALIEYGVHVKDTASTQEQMDEITKKVTRTTEEWAQTTEGRIAVMRTTWGNFKENIGSIFGPTLKVLLYNFNTFLGSMMGNSKIAGDSIAKNLASAFRVDAWQALWNRAKYVAVESSRLWVEAVGGNTDKLNQKISQIDNEFVQIGNQALQLDEALKFKDLPATINNMGGFADATDNAAKKSEDLAKKLKDVKDKISDINLKISEESESFLKKDVDLRRQAAQTIVEQEKNVANLQIELTKQTASKKATERTREDIQTINEMTLNLAKEKAALENSKSVQVNIINELADERRRASLTEFEKRMEDIERDRALNAEEFNKKMKVLKEELVLQETEHKKYTDNVKTLQGEITVNLKSELRKQDEDTKASVDYRITQANRLKQSMSSTGGMSVAPLMSTIPNMSMLPKKARGGVINQPTLALLGESGPEVVRPMGNYNGGGSGLTVNVNGGLFTDRSLVDYLVEQIEKKVYRPLAMVSHNVVK